MTRPTSGSAIVFGDIETSARIERAEAAMTVDYMRALERLSLEQRPEIEERAGATLTCSENDPYHNLVLALGLGTVPADDDLDAIEAFFTRRDRPTRIALSPLAAPDLGQRLSSRGYRIESFMNVLARPIGEAEVLTRPGHVEISLASPEQRDLWVGSAIRGFDIPPADVPWHIRLFQATAARAGTFCFFGRLNGDIACIGALTIRDGLALLHASSVLPAFRRRGAHHALLNARLSFAQVAGCDLVVVHTRPGDRSQRNLERSGFRVLYTRVSLLRDAETT